LRASDGLTAVTLPSSLAQQLPTITAGNARIAALLWGVAMKRDELLIATAALMGFQFPIETSVALPHALAVSARRPLQEIFRKVRASGSFPAFPLVVNGTTL
jgi:hypothetical protein